MKPTSASTPASAAGPATSSEMVLQKMMDLKNFAAACQMLQKSDGLAESLEVLNAFTGGASSSAIPGLQIFGKHGKNAELPSPALPAPSLPDPAAASSPTLPTSPTSSAPTHAGPTPTLALQNGEAGHATAKPEAGEHLEEGMGDDAGKDLAEYEEEAFAALQKKKGGGFKRPAAAPSKAIPAGSKKPVAGPKKNAKPQAAKAKSIGKGVLKLGCKTCRGTEKGCKTCRNPSYKGERMNRSEWKALAAVHGWK